ncbi:MAG: hypothetical protein Q4D00_08685, partial [Clostridia bacterium]|nr:hypothetical protein [Clostridia bacterium]
NFVSPGYVSKLIDDDTVDNEIVRINQSDETDENVTPPTMPKYFGQGEDRIDLTSEQYHDYVEISGRLSYSLLNNMIKTDWYDELSADEQAKLFNYVYKYSKAVARTEIDDTYVPTEKWIMEAKEAYDDYDIPVESFLMYKAKLSQFSGDEKKKEVIEFIKEQKLSKKQNKVLWHIAGYKDSSFDDNF